jgi:sarcosine oxidase
MRRTADVAVVGAGIIGLACAYELVRRGVDVRVFEAAHPGAGQSAGRTRIFRHAHRRRELIERAVESRALWERWEQELGSRLLGREGMLLTGPAAEEVAALLAEAGTPSRLVDEREQAQALPILAPPGGVAVLDELGGSTDVAATIRLLASALGDRLVRAQVFAVEPGERAVIETSEGIWEAGRAVLCAGAGIDSLAPELGIPVTLSCHARVTFRARDAGLAGRLAALQEQSGAYGETVYAAAFPGEPLYGVGLAGEGADVPLGTTARPLVDRIVAYVREALPGVDPEPVGVRLCVPTDLPDSPDCFEVWSTDSVLALVGDNLFKFAPWLGRMLAAAACGEREPEGLVPAR